MGKDLKGRELGVGISQRKDGLYTARFTGHDGKRNQKYFHKLQECRKWIADAKFNDEHETNLFGDMSVSAWFEYWIENMKGENIKSSTARNYKDRFKKNICPAIGNILLKDVKPLHCQSILNQMFAADYCVSTMNLTRITMYVLFESAVENGLVLKNPVTKAVKCPSGGIEPKPKRVLTIDEQELFINKTKGKSNYNQYAFILQTGLRTGELAGLKWSDVDIEEKSICVKRTIDYRNGEWEIKTPKSTSGYRTIPLTEEAIRILNDQKKKALSLDIISIEFHDFVFLSKKGNPVKNSTYNKDLLRICKKIGIERFSMHTLRHTFATRCIEAGMKPKTLQMILGHANIAITMNLYVHITEEEKIKEMKTIESMLKII